ncbi:MAG: outer membrane protein assembly factor BamA, partial [Ferruginibacter sp.]|nr:outer membrane protein assembly factor BamA [Cytophagales bacterium]
RQFQTYSATFTEPWLGGRRPNAFSVSLSHTVQNLFGGIYGTGRDRVGAFNISGLTLSLGRQLQKPDDFFSLSNSLSYQRYVLENYDVFRIGLASGVSNSISFNTTLSRNSVDNPQFSRSGSSISLSVSLTPPFSLLQSNRNFSAESPAERYKFIEYHKWMFDATWYTPLVGKLVLSTRAHLGFLGSYNKNLVSPFERFVVGGSGLTGQGGFNIARDIIGLRGYADNSIGPQGANQGNGGGATGSASGGVAYDKFVMELRYPISLNPSATIFVLGFAEGGNNWGSFREYNPLNLYRSVGVGARIFMPAFGLIGIDYGYCFDTVPGQPDAGGKGRFHFTIGQQFR